VLFATNEGGTSKRVRRGGRSAAAAAAAVEEWRRERDRVRLEVVNRRDVRSGVAKQRAINMRKRDAGLGSLCTGHFVDESLHGNNDLDSSLGSVDGRHL
jgi:hypothetical protein